MGRIKTQLMKRLTFDIVEMHKEKLSKEFEENKKVVAQFIPGSSKKVRNTVAGYVTRIMKRNEEF